MKNILIVGAGAVFSGSTLVREKLEQYRIVHGITEMDFEQVEKALTRLCEKEEKALNEWDHLFISTKEILNKHKIFKEPKRKFVNKFNKNQHR